MENFDVLIIGAGIAGASAAYELASSCRVAVLERESQPGYHTTGRSMAIYTQNYGNRTIRMLTLASQAFLEQPTQGFAEHPILTPRGALYIAREDQLHTLDGSLSASQALVPSIRRIDGAEAVRISPSVRPEYVAAAIYEPDARDIDVNLLHTGFLKGVRQRGGRIVTKAEVMEMSYSNRCWRIKTRAGTYCAAVVVNAAGAWCDTIAELAGVTPIGLEPKRRTMLTIEPPPGLDISSWPLTIDVDEKFYFKSDAGRILVSPADETSSPPCDAQPEEIDVATAIHRLETATNLNVKRVVNKWAGLRSFVPDKTPVVGMDPAAPGFFWLAGQGGYGIQTAAAIARAVAELIKTNTLPDDLTAMGLRASDLSPMRLRQALEFGKTR